MNQIFLQKFKEAVDFLNNSGIDSPNKPAIPHALRVGERLFNKKMPDHVVEAGILHDLLEWSDLNEKEIEKRFGSKVLQLVKANTKDRMIRDKKERRLKQINANLLISDQALAIKIADNLDSYDYYSQIKNKSEIERCKDWARLLIEYLPESLKGIFLEDLEDIV